MTDKRSKNEHIKEASRYLRGGLAEGLARTATGAIDEDDTQVIKFHGSYLQDDRDVRGERTKKKLEKAFSFMLRLRIPGGVVTPRQWLQLDQIASDFANHSIRITTRQTIQYHGVIKSNLRRTMQAINAAALDTLAACGDVNRNVLAASNPYLSKAHGAAYDLARRISDGLLPHTGAYHEIWLDGEKVTDASGAAKSDDVEPIYGRHYLPRKFKIVVAVPPDNDVDIFAHDLGYIASLDKAAGAVTGYTVTVGGGMGMTHGELDTFPRTADVLGFCRPEDGVKVAEAVVTVQRDWGNRERRARARLKYTIEDRGLPAFRAEVERRLGFALAPPKAFQFASTGDPIGWRQSEDKGRDSGGGKWHLTLSIENGRVKDVGEVRLRAALRELAQLLVAEAPQARIVLTANQNFIIANVAPKAKVRIEAILAAHGVKIATSSALRAASMACVGLPTCGLALSESERELPGVIDKLEPVLAEAGLTNEPIVMRMTGCPNGCARPYLAEIGLVGRGPGRYNLYLGAAFNGTRLSKLYAGDVDEAKVIALLTPLLQRYAKERETGERFGDFVIRAGFVKPTTAGNTFHADVALAG